MSNTSIKRLSLHIPTEVQDLIIDDLLVLDWSNLSNTSLVCKHWRQRSYTHAFSFICLRHDSVAAFKSFLDTPFSFSAIFSRVRRLRIVDTYSDGISFIPWNAEQLDALSDVIGALAHLGKVEMLSLNGVCWTFLDHRVVKSLTEMHSIESLEMNQMLFSDPLQLYNFVGNFVGLRELAFRNIEFSAVLQINGLQLLESEMVSLRPTRAGDSQSQLSDGTCCLRLRWCGNRMEKSMSWMYPACIPRETCLRVSYFGAQTSRFLVDSSSLLKSLGPLLAGLEIISQEDISDEAIASIDLSANSSLQHLSLVAPNRVFGMISWLPSILQRINCHTLRFLRVVFASSRQFHLDQPFLNYISCILDKPQFKNLQLIHFVVAANGRMDKELEGMIVGRVRSSLAFWDQRGALKCSYC